MKFKRDGADVCSDQKSDGRSDDSSDNPVVSDPASGRIDIFCKIDQKATLYLHQLLNEFKKSKKAVREVTIVVNTRGGEALQGLAIYDLVRSSGFNVRTVILGEVASSGLVIALAGKERHMHRNAVLHFHRTAMEFSPPRTVVEWEEADRERAQSKVVDDLYAAITLSNSNLTRKELEDLERREVYMTALEALKAGLVHKIIKHF